MSAQHTPGPWEWALYAPGWRLVGPAPAHTTVRAPVLISHASADGRLIEAAPELLVAAQDSLTLVNDLIAGIGVSDDRLQIERERLEAAIAKVEGRA